MIHIAKPNIGKEEIEAVSNVLKSGMLAQGKVVEEFEEAFAEYCNAKYAIATSSGTTALHTALASIGIKEKDEVITTDFSFVASASSILMQGASPVFCDVEKETFNINPLLIEEKITDKTKAILPVHLYGHPCDMKVINEIASDNDLLVLEDACQAHGAMYNNKKVGSIGDLGVFSFYPTKNMTTGEGGIIVTNDEKIAKKAKLFQNHGQHEKYMHGSLGYNYHMTNISAAIGLVQLKKLDSWNSKRRRNAEYFTNNFSKINGVISPVVKEYATHCFHQYSVIIEEDFSLKRENVTKYLQEKGVGFGIHYPLPLHKQPLFGENKSVFPVADDLSKRVLSLPIHPQLSRQDLDLIVNCFEEMREEKWMLA